MVRVILVVYTGEHRTGRSRRWRWLVSLPASSKFHAARMSMDGVLPDGTNLRTTYGLTDANIGINAAIRASHRQNYLIPPRAHRSFPLVELIK